MFGEILDLRAHEFRHTPQIGRTHGVHAEPITFGLKIANWFAENQRNIARFGEAAAQMAVVKISGAVGNASHLGPEMEERICKRLGLSVVPVASQVIQRDRHAQYLSALALIAATLEKIALEIRHLQRTEVREAEEPRSEEHTSELQSPDHLVCRLLLEKKKTAIRFPNSLPSSTTYPSLGERNGESARKSLSLRLCGVRASRSRSPSQSSVLSTDARGPH